jgi:hypothetical protein
MSSSDAIEEIVTNRESIWEPDPEQVCEPRLLVGRIADLARSTG